MKGEMNRVVMVYVDSYENENPKGRFCIAANGEIQTFKGKENENMAKNFKKGLSAILAALMCTSTMSTAAMAADTNFTAMKLVVPSSDEYNYMIAQVPNMAYYETSNHSVKIAGAVHIFPVIDTARDVVYDDETEKWIWEADGVYECGESNYNVVYCCDAVTGTREDEEDITNTYYKRLNLEDSEYVSVEQAERLRAILSVTYPTLSVVGAKEALKEAGFDSDLADQLDRSELITATLGAIWILANPDSIVANAPDGERTTYTYAQTASPSKKASWGGYMHEYTNEITNFDTKSDFNAWGYKKVTEVANRITALQDFFLNELAPKKAEAGQIVITDINMVSREAIDEDSSYVTLEVALDTNVTAADEIYISAVVNGEETASVQITEGSSVEFTVEADIGDKIKVVVDGEQYLERGVYFYAPRPQDIDGDDIATSREVSQNLIGVDEGLTTVHAEKTYVINTDKTATPLDGDYTDVTLTVYGEVNVEVEKESTEDGSYLPVDIIYILGRFLSLDDVKSDTMIGALTDTFRELINEGIPVNFGIVPFSSTEAPVMPFTALTSDADLEALPEVIAAAIEEAGNVYDGVNMENALLTATEMFSTSELGQMGRTDRQHLVLVSSGHTYYFNGGENNEYISTVPVMFKKGDVDTNEIFYMEKAWMRARNNSTNSYPIPKAIVNYYNANTDKYDSEWDCYWSLIDQWAKADIAAGDIIVYEATTRAAGDFIAWMNSGKYSADSSTFTYSGNGAVVSDLGNNRIEDVLEFDMTNSAERGVVHGVSGPNPFRDESVAHAISYERAMWEAYTFIQKNITGEGINFYPVYAPLRADGTASNGSHYDYTWTTNYIGHCFMNMLAGGEAVTWSADKVFFDGIKAEIVESSTSGEEVVVETVIPYVVDYIGFDAKEGYDFDFTGENIVLAVDGEEYITDKNGDIYSFYASEEADEPSFTLEYFRGNGKDEEHFVWYFYETIEEDSYVTLTYQLALVQRNEADGNHIAYTNQSAVLYPEGDPENGQVFPRPKVEYGDEEPDEYEIFIYDGEASHIRYLYVDKATGDVWEDADAKIDFEDSCEADPVKLQDGIISVVFIKQAQSGMIWSSEEVTEENMADIVDILTTSNAYKGHDAECVGEGDHELTYSVGNGKKSKSKTVIYSFDIAE